jgi:hypothetical protein
VNNRYTYGSGTRYKHVLIAEKALGRALPKGAQIHHVDNNGKNNANNNLVICPNFSYHALLHMRTRALEACGNASWVKCVVCRTWDDRANQIAKKPKLVQYYHKRCAALYQHLRKIKSYSELNKGH